MLEDIIRKVLFLPEERNIKDEDGPGVMEEWDSMGHVNIIDAVEDQYGIQINPEETLKIQSVKDLKDILVKKGIKKY